MGEMKFKFKIQQYQTDAVEAVVRVFNGQAHNDARIQCGNFTCGAFRHGGTSGNEARVGNGNFRMQKASNP